MKQKKIKRAFQVLHSREIKIYEESKKNIYNKIFFLFKAALIKKYSTYIPFVCVCVCCGGLALLQLVDKKN
jgi:hypothetical protein